MALLRRLNKYHLKKITDRICFSFHEYVLLYIIYLLTFIRSLKIFRSQNIDRNRLSNVFLKNYQIDFAQIFTACSVLL